MRVVLGEMGSGGEGVEEGGRGVGVCDWAGEGRVEEEEEGRLGMRTTLPCLRNVDTHPVQLSSSLVVSLDAYG